MADTTVLTAGGGSAEVSLVSGAYSYAAGHDAGLTLSTPLFAGALNCCIVQTQSVQVHPLPLDLLKTCRHRQLLKLWASMNSMS